MSRPDATASAALGAPVIRPVFFAYLDFEGDPLYANTSGASYTFGTVGNPDLDGKTFDGIDPELVNISPVRIREGGSETVTASLSGLIGLNDELLAIIGDKSKWQGRQAQLWRMIRDENGTQKGAIQHYYTGYMVSVRLGGSPENQTIEVDIEIYLAAYSQASHRTYLDQETFDPGDLSARAAISIANGTSGSPLISNTPGGGGSGGGSGRGYEYDMDSYQRDWLS